MIVNYKKPNVMTLNFKDGNRVQLLPGKNIVDDKYHDEIKEHPHLKKMIAGNEIALQNTAGGQQNVKSGGGTTGSKEKIESHTSAIENMTVAEATDFINECNDVTLLENIAAEDDRKGVKKACHERVEYINKLTEPDGD